MGLATAFRCVSAGRARFADECLPLFASLPSATLSCDAGGGGGGGGFPSWQITIPKHEQKRLAVVGQKRSFSRKPLRAHTTPLCEFLALPGKTPKASLGSQLVSNVKAVTSRLKSSALAAARSSVQNPIGSMIKATGYGVRSFRGFLGGLSAASPTSEARRPRQQASIDSVTSTSFLDWRNRSPSFVVLSPRGCFATILDGLGRLHLIDTSTLAVVRCAREGGSESERLCFVI